MTRRIKTSGASQPVQHELGLGYIIHREAHRDAVHVAVTPCVALDRLDPGQHVGISPRVVVRNVPSAQAHSPLPVGIVDPFLLKAVVPGETFWLFLYPGSITSLRHEWKHPAIDGPIVSHADSERWLMDFANRWEMNYSNLIEDAQDFAGSITAGTLLYGSEDLGEDHDLFWSHLENLTGDKFDVAHRIAFGWHCSC